MRRHLLAVAAAGLTMLAGCSSDGAGKSGGGAPPITLSVATDDDGDLPAGKQILHFAEQVEQISGGAIEIEPAWHAAGHGIAQWDQAVAERVVSGDNDLGLLPTRTWDALGVTSLRALNTPFLIIDDPTVDAVVQSDVVPDLLSGLPDAGVTGLSLFPEGLRHPFGSGSPLLSVKDYEGGTIRSPYSETTWALLTALGAKPTDAEYDKSKMRGAESSFAHTPGGTPTGNVVFYPKINVLVINDHARAELSEDQLETLTQAAAATQQWVLDTEQSDADGAAAWCASGGEIAASSPDQIAAMQVAAEPVTAQLREDPLTADLIDRIAQLAASSTPTPITSCQDVR